MTRKSPMTRSARAIRAANSRRKPKAPLPRFWARTATSPWRWARRPKSASMSAYASYPVTSSTTSLRSAETSSVSRRFSDFTRLRKALRTAHPGVIVYPLPREDGDHLAVPPRVPRAEARRPGHLRARRRGAPTLRRSEHLRAFLEDPGGGWPASEDPERRRERATRAGRRRRRALPFRRRRAVRGTPRRRPRRRLGTSAARRSRRWRG